MHRLLMFFIVVGFLVCSTDAAQGQIIADIQFEGLKRTDESFLRNIITSKIGANYQQSNVDEDIQRLVNLASIGSAEYKIAVEENTIKIIYKVQEIRTLLPILNAGGIRDNLWMQIGFTDINWRGRGQQLSAVYQNNDSRNGGNIYFNY